MQYEEPASRETEESEFESDETESESDKTESESDKTEFENESEGSEKSESEEETETKSQFPNNTYSDLMSLIIQYNLNNKARNAIIHFFNKHSNLPISLLPKNIEQGRKLMDRMKLNNLLNKEKVILNYNNKDYTLYYCPIINCIKNILSINDIHKYMAFNFKNDQVINFNNIIL
jgi:cobalamin biosynthesis protein CobT